MCAFLKRTVLRINRANSCRSDKAKVTPLLQVWKWHELWSSGECSAAQVTGFTYVQRWALKLEWVSLWISCFSFKRWCAGYTGKVLVQDQRGVRLSDCPKSHSVLIYEDSTTLLAIFSLAVSATINDTAQGMEQWPLCVWFLKSERLATKNQEAGLRERLDGLSKGDWQWGNSVVAWGRVWIMARLSILSKGKKEVLNGLTINTRRILEETDVISLL